MKTTTFKPLALTLLFLMAGNYCFSQYFTATDIGGGATIRFPGAITQTPMNGGKKVICSTSDYNFMTITLKRDDYFLPTGKDKTDIYYDALIQQMSGGHMTDIHAKDFTCNGIPGKDFTFAYANGNFGRCRVLINQGMAYNCTIVSATLDNVKSGVADVFLDSFRLEKQ